MPYDEVVNLLDTETVDYGIAFGSAMSEQLEVSIKVDKDKYKEAIVWLRKLLFASEFSVDRWVFCSSGTRFNLLKLFHAGCASQLKNWFKVYHRKSETGLMWRSQSSGT